jgi:integrase/recombinase XerD
LKLFGGVLNVKRGEVKGRQQFNEKADNSKAYKELFEEFMLSTKLKGRSEYTMKSYQYHSKYFTEFLKATNQGSNTLCRDINEKMLEDYILYMQDVKGITNNITINSYLRNVSPIIKFGIRKRYIPEDFEIPSVKYQETFKEIYSEEDIAELLEKPKKRDFSSMRTWAIIWTLTSTGLRARELRELKVKGVDLMNRTITVNATKNKKARYLPISNSLTQVLTEYLSIRGGKGDDYLFPTVYGERMAQSTLQKSIMLYCKARGVDKYSLHLFRHTFITNAVNQNVSPLILQRITGHCSMKELNRYYNAKTSDMVNILDEIAPKISRKESLFKKGSDKAKKLKK